MTCPRCGSDNPAGKKFCGECGSALAGSTSADAPPASPATETRAGVAPERSGAASAASGERRHLTVIFGDLVNSTEIASYLDPEEWHGIAAQYQRTAAMAVARLGGHVAKYLGDGLMVVFGWPTAHEDDAERAVRAGLAMVDAVAALNEHLAGEHRLRLSVRVGIHAGSVVVGQGGGTEADVFGDAPNIAARVQAVATPDSVLISAAVHDLVAGRFVVEDRGAHQLKGIERPLQLYRAIRPSVVRRRRHRAAGGGLTPFVGREDEMRVLLKRWAQAVKGEGQVVLVVGESGIGKSRLVEEFRTRIKDDAHTWIDGGGERFCEGTPFHVVIQMLDQRLGARGEASKEQRVSRLERALQLTGMDLGEAVPLIAEIMHLPAPEKYPPLMLTPDQERRRLLASLVTWVLGAARSQPLVIAMEDLHWVDPSTLELTQTLVEQAATAPLMLLGTARPEFRAPWPAQPHHAQITLSRLNDLETRAMITGLAARALLASDMIDTVVKRTDGVPLFAEELTRLILEGDGRPAAREIPVTLQGSLTARLDRLGPTREVAQVAAVLGREFSYELLHAVSPAPEAELQSALEKLADAELIYARGLPPSATYQFKHALIQDAAYEGLLKSKRRELHHLVARTISERFSALADAQPQILARHWTEAGEAEPAITAWKAAGDAAYARRAFKEAEGSYQQAQAMLNTLPASPQRDARELDLCSAFVQVLQLTRGYSAPETVEAAARARALAEKVGNLAELFLQEVRTWSAIFVTGDYPGAAALADHILGLAVREDGETRRVAFAHTAQVQARFYRGDLAGVEEHFAQLTDFIDTVGFRQAPGSIVITIGATGLAAWISGRADCARERIARAVAFGRDNRNPYDLAFALLFESYLYRFQREPRRAETAAAQVLALSEEHGFSWGQDLARGVMGWAWAQLGRASEGVSLIRQALAGMVAARARVGITDVLTRLAEAEAIEGATVAALSTIERALQANPEELIFRPNTLSCRGALRLAVGQTELAESDFRAAIAMAQEMTAKAWELRAAMPLARILLARRDCAAARDLLAPLYGWFTEGLDIADLQDASSLLAELGA